MVTLFIGTVQALKQHDAKRLHAYHSLGQMGYILLGIGTAQYFLLSGSPVLRALGVLALLGGIYHSINHVLFKGLLFLCTGSVQYATGTKDLDQLGGLIKLMPLTALTAAVASRVDRRHSCIQRLREQVGDHLEQPASAARQPGSSSSSASSP